jgi:hypothetical protein
LCHTTGSVINEDIRPREIKCQETMITEEGDDWRQPFIEYFQRGTLTKDKKAADQLRKWVL